MTGTPPSGTGCVECEADRRMVGAPAPLRECGHVGCCDTSPAQHATAHFRESGHPVVQSFEPGEDWFWDYAQGEGRARPAARAADQPARGQPVPGPAARVPADWRDHIH